MATQKQLDAVHSLKEARRYFSQDHNYLAAAALLCNLIPQRDPNSGVSGEHYRVLAQCYHQLIAFDEEEIGDSFREATAEGFDADELWGVIADRARWREQAEQCLKRYEAAEKV